MKPSLEEARKDLDDIRNELTAMQDIFRAADFLRTRPDCDAVYYGFLYTKVRSDIAAGLKVENQIIERYPELT